MNAFQKQLLAVGGLGVLGFAALIAASSSDAAPRVSIVEETEAARPSVPGRTEEYDYDPPAPGSYQLPILKDASDGTVVGPDGRSADLHQLLDGRIAILSFIYTRCSDPRACLRASGVLSQLQEMSRQDKSVATKLQLITLSFDPGNDTPEVMERYGRVFSRHEGGADWLFLTTRNREDLQPLLEAYGQRVDKRTKPSVLGPFQHTLRVYLIDSKKRIRNIYSYGLFDPRLVMADVKTLLQETPESTATTANSQRVALPSNQTKIPNQ